MGLEIKKREKESSQNLIRRFSRGVQQSGILLRVRKNQFKRREKSKNMKKKAALRRELLKKEHEKLWKLGEIE